MESRPMEPKPDLSSLKIDQRSRKAANGGKGARIFAATLGVLVLISGLAFALWRPKTHVEVATARSVSAGEERAALLNASGYVTPRVRATIAAKITGRVTGIFVDEGMHVKAGQVLATLDDSDVRRALDAAKADRDATAATVEDLQIQLANAELELHRAQELQASGVGTQQALDTARTARDSLKARIALTKAQVSASMARIQEAQQAVDNTVIRAPFDGVAVSKDAQMGEMVSPISAGGGFTRTGISTIVDMRSLEIEVDVNEAYIARVQPGQPVTATLDAYPDWHIPSKVRTVIPTADRQKATVKVRISFLRLDPRILPDMGVKVAFLSEEKPAAKGSANAAPRVVVPQGAVHNDGGKQTVFLVRDGKVERRAVSLGATRDTDVEVIAGVSAGDSVVVKGPAGLQDGQAVEVQP